MEPAGLSVHTLRLILSARKQKGKQFVHWVARDPDNNLDLARRQRVWFNVLNGRQLPASSPLFLPILRGPCGCEQRAAKPKMKPVRMLSVVRLSKFKPPVLFDKSSRLQPEMCRARKFKLLTVSAGMCLLPVVRYHLFGLVDVKVEVVVTTPVDWDFDFLPVC